MSIFGSIVSKIFHHGGEAPPAETASTDARAPSATASAPAPGGSAPAAPTSAGTSAAPASPATSGRTVDVEKVMEDLAAKNGQNLNWRQSIVDMMKLLDLDSSLSSRKELAKELHYTGDMNDSASMNVWLHGQVMKKLAENGGKVPDDLKAA